MLDSLESAVAYLIVQKAVSDELKTETGATLIVNQWKAILGTVKSAQWSKFQIWLKIQKKETKGFRGCWLPYEIQNTNFI